MPPKPAAADPKASKAPEPDTHELTEAALQDMRREFTDPFAGEQLAVELSEELLERSSALYLDTLYDRLALDYTAAALWEQMASIVAVCNVQPDRDAAGRSDAALAAGAAAAEDEGLVTTASGLIPPIATTESALMSPASNLSMGAPAIAPVAAAADAKPSKPASKTGAKTPGSSKSGKTPRSVRIATGSNSPVIEPPTPPLPAPVTTDATSEPSATPPVAAQPAPTWHADAAPERIACDRHTRHNIPLLRKKPPTPATTAPTPSESASPSSARRRRGPRGAAGGGGSDPNMLGGTLRGALSDAGSSRPQSRASSASTNAVRPAPKPSTATQRRMSRVGPPPPRRPSDADKGTEEERASTPQQEQPPQLTAEEQAVLAAAEADEARKESVRRTHANIAAQLADTKALERGFVVDGASARVVPLIPPEEMLSSAKKLAEPLRFAVPEAAPQPYPQPPNTAPAGGAGGGSLFTPAGQRSGKPGDKGNKSEAKRSANAHRREENYFVPDHTAVAMVQPVTPVGGVTVKDTDGAPRSAEMQVPRNKMTKADFDTATKAQQQHSANTETPQERSIDVPGALPRPAPNTARQPAQASAKPDIAPTNTARGPGDAAKAAPVVRPQPPSTAPQGVARRLPLTPGSAASANQQQTSPASRKSKARSQAAATGKQPRKSGVTAAAPGLARELLSDELA